MNVIRPPLPGGHVIYCDDIREEVGGKTTLVGTYGGEMTIFGSPPVKLAKFCVLIFIRLDPADIPPEIIVRVLRLERGDEREVLLEATMAIPDAARQIELPPASPDARQIMEMRLAQQFDGVEFTGPCTISTRAYIADNEYRIGSIEIKIASREDALAVLGPGAVMLEPPKKQPGKRKAKT